MTEPAPDIPYGDVAPDELTLRDHLAAERTELANERTLLAYTRTALGLLVAGAGLIHFVDSLWSVLLGWALIACAPVAVLVGAYRFVRVRRTLAAFKTP